MPSMLIPALNSYFPKWYVSSTLGSFRCSHTAPSSPPSTPAPDKENKTNPHSTFVKMEDFNKVWESCAGVGGRQGLHCIPFHKQHQIVSPKPVLKTHPALEHQGFLQGLGPTQSRSRIALQQIPLLFSALPLLSCSLPGENHNCQQTNISGRAVCPFLSGALTLPTPSLHLLTLVIDQGIFPDKESFPEISFDDK